MAEIENNIEEPTEPKKSLEEQFAEMLAENKRLKRGLDKASSEAADYKHRLNEKLTEAEKADAARSEEQVKIQEELTELRRERDISRMSKNFTVLGYSQELAEKAAEAQFDGRTEDLFEIQRQYKSELENTIKAQFLKGMPDPSGSGNQPKTALTIEQVRQMSADEINANWAEVQEAMKNSRK